MTFCIRLFTRRESWTVHCSYISFKSSTLKWLNVKDNCPREWSIVPDRSAVWVITHHQGSVTCYLRVNCQVKKRHKVKGYIVGIANFKDNNLMLCKSTCYSSALSFTKHCCIILSLYTCKNNICNLSMLSFL